MQKRTLITWMGVLLFLAVGSGFLLPIPGQGTKTHRLCRGGCWIQHGIKATTATFGKIINR